MAEGKSGLSSIACGALEILWGPMMPSLQSSNHLEGSFGQRRNMVMKGNHWVVKISRAEGKAEWHLRIYVGVIGHLSKTSNATIAEIEYWKDASNAA